MVKIALPHARIQKFALLQIAIIIFFTLIYWIALTLENNRLPEDKQEDTNLIDLFRFTLYTQTTIGYGDVNHLESTYFKIANIIQMLSVLLSLFYY